LYRLRRAVDVEELPLADAPPAPDAEVAR